MSEPTYLNMACLKYSHDRNLYFTNMHPTVSAEQIGMRISSAR